MKKNIKEVKEVPTKNYFIVLVVSILVVVFVLYVRSFYLNYQANNVDVSVFEGKNQINIDDIEYAVNETTDGIIFVSYNGETQIKMMERKLYKEIEKKNLNDNVLYLNINDNIEENMNILRNKFGDFAVDIKKAPIFIYVKDGKCVEVVDSSVELINYKTLNTLLSKYEIE